MDFKNFIDILSTPKNIGSNKWVLNNFSDLKSSNDYLHIIRLRYDNRWLRIYWDGKLKEVEKDYNFYVSTPIKSKLFLNSAIKNNNFNILKTQLTFSNNNKLNLCDKDTTFSTYFDKKVKKKIEDGEVRNSFYQSDLNNFSINNKLNYNLDNNFLDYRFEKNYYIKNIKNPIKSLDEVDGKANL
jgi:hypothetical protein